MIFVNLFRLMNLLFTGCTLSKGAFTNDVIILGGRGFGKDDER